MLHRFFSLLESRSEFTYPSPLLADGIGPEAAQALCRAGVLGPAGPATWYPCARRFRDCRRTVATGGEELHVLCGRASGGCPAEVFPAADLGQHGLDESALLRLLQRLFGVEGQPARREGRGQPMGLGRSLGGDCDVWAWLRPEEPVFTVWMGELEPRAPGKRALVLVPTHARIRTETFERYGPGQPIEVVHLDRALTLELGEIVRTARPAERAARVPWTQEPVVTRPGASLRVPAGVRWSHITFEYVDDDVVAMRVGAHAPRRLSAADLGLARESTAKGSRLWELLLALCAGSGVSTRRRIGASSLEALRVPRGARLSRRMCRAFGIPEPALHVDKQTESVRADFVALPETRRASTRRPPR